MGQPEIALAKNPPQPIQNFYPLPFSKEKTSEILKAIGDLDNGIHTRIALTMKHENKENTRLFEVSVYDGPQEYHHFIRVASESGAEWWLNPHGEQVANPFRTE